LLTVVSPPSHRPARRLLARGASLSLPARPDCLADPLLPLHPLTLSSPSSLLPLAHPQAIRSGLAEAQRVAGGSGTEEEKAEAQIEVQVYEALQNALKA